MHDFVVEVDRSVPLSNALVLTAFPTLGNVSSVAARFLIEVADLKCIGGIYSPNLPPVASVHEGRPVTAVEIWAGEHACGLDGVCDSLVVVTSHVRPSDEAAHDLAVAILDWSREVGEGEIVILEGVKTDRTEHLPAVFGVAASQKARDRLLEKDVHLLDDGLIAGVSGVLLHRGASWGLDVYGFFARATEATADAQAAAELVRAVDRVLIGAGFADAAIEDSVEQVEEKVKERQREGRSMPLPADIAYI